MIVQRLREGLVEGTKVKQGELILEIEPKAANLIAQLKGSLKDVETKLATAEAKVQVYGQNVIDFQAAQDAAVEAADEMVAAAKAKWEAKQRLLPAYEAKKKQANLDFLK